MLEAIGAAPGSVSEIDWFQTWRSSPEYQAVQEELARLKTSSTDQLPSEKENDAGLYREFAAPLWQQFLVVTQRVFQRSWRTPSYIYSKLNLCIASSLFVGLVFCNAPLTIQGLQNQLFAIFELSSIFGQLIDQQMPHFVTQRALYEVRERPAKAYSWKVFMLSQIVSEIPWNTVASVFMWAFIYYPVGFYKNADAAGQSTERAALMWLLFWQFMIFNSTFAHMCISFSDTADEGGNTANFLFVLIFFFCGVLATPDAMPGFWIFLYRVSPLSYWVSAILSVGLANVNVTCANNEWIALTPPSGQTCSDYMTEYMSRMGGYLLDPVATSNCSYCKIESTNVFLSGISSDYEDRWRNFGIMWTFIAFNIMAAIFLYWIARMPKGKKKR
jgi:ATP-binding cassette, subfamily G (WHITE), member 2, PDR